MEASLPLTAADSNDRRLLTGRFDFCWILSSRPAIRFRRAAAHRLLVYPADFRRVIRSWNEIRRILPTRSVGSGFKTISERPNSWTFLSLREEIRLRRISCWPSGRLFLIRFTEC